MVYLKLSCKLFLSININTEYLFSFIEAEA